MARLEEQLRRKLRLPVALIERATSPARPTSARISERKKRSSTTKLHSTHSRASRRPANRRSAR
jgi:hypothetical protein